MSIVTILIPSTYYTGLDRPALGLSAGEITYDVTPSVDIGKSGKLEVSVRAKEAKLSNVSLEVSVAGSVANGAPVGAGVAGALALAPTTIKRPRGARFTLAELDPQATLEATYGFRITHAQQGWSETHVVLSASELRRPIELRFHVPTKG